MKINMGPIINCNKAIGLRNLNVALAGNIQQAAWRMHTTAYK
jgi:hypothetical protein